MPYTSKEGEPVEVEAWQWIAAYGDNDGLRQFDPDSGYHYFAEIDQDKITQFMMMKSDGSGKHIAVDVPKGAKLIHFYDNIMRQPVGGDQVETFKLYCFGYETSKSDKHIWVILPNDFVVKTDSAENIGVV